MAGNSSLFAAYHALGPKQPCSKDCAGRKPGCAINCEKWAAYLVEREKFYKKRNEEAELMSRTNGSRMAAYRKIKQKKNEPGWH